MVTPELDQKIDIVDSETACAYEFKVSGKNAWAEFYRRDDDVSLDEVERIGI